MPLILPGSLHPSNSNAISWNNNGLLAYGSHCTLVIIDVLSKRIIQTLEKHNAAVNLVCWSPEGEFPTTSDSILRCASVDISGVIVIWDVLDVIEWPQWEETNRDFLLALHSSNIFVLWNTVTGDRVWNVTYSSNLLLFATDLFNMSTVTFGVIDGSLLLINDVLLHKAPSDRGSSIIIVCVEMECECVLWRHSSELQIFRFFCCRERDVIWIINSNGSVNLRTCQIINDDRGNMQLKYERILCCETQRQSTHHRITGVSFCGITQSTLAFLYNSGRIAFYQLALLEDDCFRPYRSRYITDFINMNNLLELYPAGTLRLLNMGEIFSLGQSAHSIRMRHVDGENKLHLAAVGTNQGVIHLVNVFTANIFKEYHIHSCPIKCLEWGGIHTLISAAYSHPLSTSSLVRNDIFVTDIRTGESKRLRPETEETPIEMLRVSFYQCYLAIGFRSEPLEIWHLKSMRLLRRMSRACPVITDMAWSGKHNTIKRIGSSDSVFRENLVVLDQDCHLYHVVVKGLHVRDGKEVNSQWRGGISSLKCLVWKDDYLAMGDAMGRLRVWDLGNRQCRQTSGSLRGPILKMSFSRLNGDHSLAVLHSHCIALWDCDQLSILQILTVGTSLTLLDMDLCGVCPVVLCSDNSFRYIPSVIVNLPVNQFDIPLLVDAIDKDSLFDEVNERFAALFEILDFATDSFTSANIFEKKCKIITDGSFSNFKSESDSDLILSNTDPCLHQSKHLLSGPSSPNFCLKRCRAIHRLLGNKWLYDLLSIIDFKLGAADLSPHLMLFWSGNSSRHRAELLLSCLMNIPNLSSKQIDILVHRAIVLSKREWAMQMLLNSRENCRINALRACLLASDVSSEGAQNGVQMLFLIGHHKDACRYLQIHGMWNLSVYFAKIVMKDCAEVQSKWLENLSARNTQKVLCYFLLACMGEWDRLLTSLTTNSKCKTAWRICNFLQAASIELNESTLQHIQANIS